MGRPAAYHRFPDALLEEVPLLQRRVELMDDRAAAGSAAIEVLRRLRSGSKRTGTAGSIRSLKPIIIIDCDRA